LLSLKNLKDARNIKKGKKKKKKIPPNPTPGIRWWKKMKKKKKLLTKKKHKNGKKKKKEKKKKKKNPRKFNGCYLLLLNNGPIVNPQCLYLCFDISSSTSLQSHLQKHPILQ